MRNTLNPEWQGANGHLRLSTAGGWTVGGKKHRSSHGVHRDISECALLVRVFDDDPTGNELAGQVSEVVGGR